MAKLHALSLAKDLQTALIQSQQAFDLIVSASQLGSSLTASSFLNDDLDLQKLVEKVAILRLTVFTQVYTDKASSTSIPAKLTQAKQQSTSDSATIDRILLLLSKQPESLISHLWFEALRLCTHHIKRSRRSFPGSYSRDDSSSYRASCLRRLVCCTGCSSS